MKMRRKVIKMKSKPIILIALGILFAITPIINNNLNFNAGNSNTSTEYRDDINFDKENLKISAVSEKIHIDNNWTAAETAGICTGEGTYSDPYVIEDLIIDAGGSGSGIWIENSDVYFRIENCTVSNSGIFYYAGIKLSHVNNSLIIDNDLLDNWHGIFLENSDNNTISGNTANNNHSGIYLYNCDNNIISGNTANNNHSGIYLRNSDNNIVSGNTLVGNDECIFEEDCQGNIFSDNGDCIIVQGNGGIPIGLIVLISVISGGAVIVVTGILIRKRRRSKDEVAKFYKLKELERKDPRVQDEILDENET